MFNLSIIARFLDCFQVFTIINKFSHVHLFSHSEIFPLRILFLEIELLESQHWVPSSGLFLAMLRGHCLLSFAPATSYGPRLVSNVCALEQRHTHTQTSSEEGPRWAGQSPLRRRNQNLLPFALELLAIPGRLTDYWNQQEETVHGQVRAWWRVQGKVKSGGEGRQAGTLSRCSLCFGSTHHPGSRHLGSEPPTLRRAPW